MIEVFRQALLWTLDALGGLLPALGAASSWLVVVVWVLWGVGALLLLAIAGPVHLLLGRARPTRALHA
jgi:hypothetical protein